MDTDANGSLHPGHRQLPYYEGFEPQRNSHDLNPTSGRSSTRNLPWATRTSSNRTNVRKPPRSTAGEEEQELDELDAPAPVQHSGEPGEQRDEEYLEGGQTPDNEGGAASSIHASVSALATQLYIISYLIFFSFLGTLCRVGLEWLCFYPGAPVTISVLWANFGGCILMGFLSEDRKLFREEWGDVHEKKFDAEKGSTSGKSFHPSEHSKVKKTIPLFMGLTTGFCGSFTSFSTFARDMFLALANDVATPYNHQDDNAPSADSTRSRNRGYSVLALLAVIILTLNVNIAALQLGAHIAMGSERYTPTLPFNFLRKICDRLAVFLAIGCWIGAIAIAIIPPDLNPAPETWRGEILFALVFAPLGCLLRFYLSLKLNRILASFPLGTFAANIFGTAVLAMCYDLQHSRLPLLVGGGVTGCQVLQGVEDGFCGCLTTVSTWVLELTTLQRRHSYRYGATMVGVALAVVILLMGSVRWSIGFQSAACATVTS